MKNIFFNKRLILRTNTYKSFLLLILLALFLLSGCGKSPEEKAKEFMAAGMYEQAKVFLKEEINKKPTNANLHFLLGKTLLAINEIKEAQQSFDRAMRLDVNKGKLIGTAYFEEGEATFKKNDIKRADFLFTIAYKYDSSLAAKIADLYTNAAIDNLNKLNIEQAQSLAISAKHYNPNIVHKVAEEAMDKAKAIAEPKRITTIFSLGELAVSLNAKEANNWGSLTYEIMSKSPSILDPKNLLVAGKQALDWNPNLREEIVKLYFSQASKALQDKNYPSVSLFLRAAVSINPSIAERAAELAWSELTKYFDALPSLGSNNFTTLFKLCKKFGLGSKHANTQEFALANALQLYLEGNRERAVTELKKIATASSANSKLKKVALNILAPPKPGIYDINSKPFRFTGTRGSGMGWGGSKGLDITLIKLIVNNKQIQLVFSLKAGEKPDKLLFIPKKKEIRWGVISGKELLYIIDDNGKKFVAINGFKGGKQGNFNDTVREINVQEREEVLVTATFPIPSPGATRIKFVSPRLDGWQTEWWWDNIVLKKGPFDK